ncbi:von Willebrand factor type A domain-containing protein [Streptomyces sp. NPDC087420]|uniref:vWA domain-containing protein n=1 Tax=Streptomyces sp. NPDC087420 TaxID=3365785 RepID=UPI003836B90A
MRLSPRICRSAAAGAIAGALLLTGCSGGTGSGDGKASSGGGPRAWAGGSGGTGGSGGPATGVEEGTDEGEQKFAPPDYLSTFALDVDTASYGYAVRSLDEGRRPEPSTVRPEEFINSFRQDYDRPGGNGFSVTLDGARVSGEDDPDGAGPWSLVRVGLATRLAEDGGERPPAALTFVVDVSGSMAEPGRLDLVKESLSLLTDELRDDDSIALVTFSGEARTRLTMTRVGDGRERIQRTVADLEPSDSTNLEAGVRTGYEEAVEGRRKGATNRVVLLSDALANTGETQADAILERIASARERHGITLFGVGVGSEYGDALMERLADKGDGSTTYISDKEEARKVFVDQLPAQVELRARDAKAQVAFDRRTVERFRLIGYENRAVADEDFRNDRVDGGEVGPGHTVTALYAVQLRPGAEGEIAKATVRWLDPGTRAPRERSGSVRTDAVDTALWSEAKPRLQVTAVAAYFAEELRGGTVPGAPALDTLAERAGALAESTEDPSVGRLAEAIRRADRLRD